MTTEIDIDITNALDSQREAAADRINNPHRSHTGPDPFDPIRVAMRAHPEFSKEDSRFFLGKQIVFFVHHQAINLMRVSLALGSAEALRWYRRVRATRVARMRVVATVYGIWVNAPVSISNGVHIDRISSLPESPNSRMAKQIAGFMDTRHAAAVFEVPAVNAVDDVGDNGTKSHGHYLDVIEKIRNTVTAFTLGKDAAPTVAESWLEFTDPEMEAAYFGTSWTSSRHEGRHRTFPATVDDTMIAWVEKYLRLPRDAADACRIPLERLNLARRRLHPGDMAIDGSVGLEALLSGSGRGELTHKLSTRAALLLGTDLADRKRIRKSVQDFYRLRSDIVHGSASRKPDKDKQTAEGGLRFLHAVIQEVIQAGVVPNPEEWELTGGPPANRFHAQQKPGDPVSLTDPTPQP